MYLSLTTTIYMDLCFVLLKFKTPSPQAYQTTCTNPIEFETSEKPFLVGADRFPVYRRDINEVLPG